MHLLVPLDGSRFSEHALPLARAIARHTAGSLHLIHVHTPIPGNTVEALPRAGQMRNARRTNEQIYLELLEQRLAAESLHTTCSVLEGPVTTSIIKRAEELPANLVVMTTHGHGGLARLWMGSTADSLIRESHIPILLVRPGDSHFNGDEATPIRRIAIPLDGSQTAEQILAPALTLGSFFDADYTLIRVVDVDVDAGIPDMVRDLQLEHDLIQERVQAAQSYLDNLAEQLRLEGARVQTRVLLDMDPASAVLREIRTLQYDLVALATHGRGGLPRMLLGSVTDRVVRQSTVPVLVCHPQLDEDELLELAGTLQAHAPA